jgi:hypothetical protein
MTDVFNVVYADIKPERSLKDTWAEFATSLRAGGVGDEQLGDMEIAFYMGAAQTFLNIDVASKVNSHTLSRIMTDIYRDVDAHMKRNQDKYNTEGNA